MGVRPQPCKPPRFFKIGTLIMSISSRITLYLGLIINKKFENLFHKRTLSITEFKTCEVSNLDSAPQQVHLLCNMVILNMHYAF